MDENSNNFRNFDLASFQKAKSKMIATNDNAYNGNYNRNLRSRTRDYSQEEIRMIVDSGSLVEQQKLSRNYFNKDGFYKQILIHYATLLKYSGILIPNPSAGKSLSTSHLLKRYYNALDFVDHLSLPTFLTNCAVKALVDGCYYGVIVQLDKTKCAILDLPAAYCASRYKDTEGNDIIEFDVTYFNTITNPGAKEAALSAYPDFISRGYDKWKKGRLSSKWIIVPSDIGICFPFFEGRPLFLSTIPATIEYDKSVALEQARDAEEIRKIIVQKIPHLQDGRLVFEPEEAEEIHEGTVGMLKNNENISVLTTYADVDSIVSKTQSDNVNSHLDRMLNNIYANAGVSGQIFSSTGSSTLDTSLKNDLALMMYLANKFSVFITNIVNRACANSNINFRYMILPVSYYNEDKYVDTTYKLANSGYSYLLPALAMGLTQRDLGNVKDLENDVLKLGEKLIPLSSAFTQSADAGEAGRPAKSNDEKSDKTIQNEESLDNQTEGGSN